MNVILKNILTALLMGGTLVPAFAYAADSTSTATQTLVNQLQSVQNELNALRAQQQGNTTVTAPGLVTELHEGSTGPEVRILQALLAADPSIYPEGVISGYYGKLTAEAVARFQTKNALDPVGFVGPKTLKALQALLSRPPTPDERAITSTDDAAVAPPCMVVPASHLIATSWLYQNTGANSVVLECTDIPQGIYSKLVAGSTTPTAAAKSDDKTRPELGGVKIERVSGTTDVIISWHTDEPATSRVAYVATTSNYPDFSNASSTGSSALVLDHTVTITGLLPSTTYRLLPGSVDAAGNSATASSRVLITSSL